MNWTDPAVQSALIQAAGTLLAAIVAAICAAVIGKQFADRKNLQNKLRLAQHDLIFMLAVEQAHCQRNMDAGDESYKLRMRQVAYDRGLTWSGKFTPGRTRANLLSAPE